VRHLAWATDIHLDHVGDAEIERFGAALGASSPEAVVLTGDVSEAPSLVEHLERLASAAGRPVYFVLGNHDFHRGSVDRVRAEVAARFPAPPLLDLHGRMHLIDERTALVGADGWGDARLGRADDTPIELTDFVLIEELAGLEREARTQRLRALGDASAEALRAPLEAALEAAPRTVVLTHVPPFAAACWYQGSTSHPEWWPYFTCAAVGGVLREAAARRPDRTIEVLCGHTHNPGVAEILPNLIVRTGGAEYGAPEVQPPIPLASTGLPE
jgi:predicted phosphohydrolase